jgi:F-type H+-transporting ATPase subunit b
MSAPGRGKRLAECLIGAGTFALLMVGAAMASEAAGHGGGITSGQIYDLTWRTFNFVIFAGILGYLLVKKVPVKEFFQKRSQEIARALEDLENQKAAAHEALKEAEARLAEVAAERDKILQQYVAEGEMEKAKILDKAEQVAARIREMAEITIEQETKKAAQKLKQELVDSAAKLSEGLLTKKITPDDHQRLVEEYLNKVVESH